MVAVAGRDRATAASWTPELSKVVHAKKEGLMAHKKQEGSSMEMEKGVPMVMAIRHDARGKDTSGPSDLSPSSPQRHDKLNTDTEAHSRLSPTLMVNAKKADKKV